MTWSMVRALNELKSDIVVVDTCLRLETTPTAIYLKNAHRIKNVHIIIIYNTHGSFPVQSGAFQRSLI